MEKKAYFFIDDVIWVFRDLTQKRPASIFDNPFLKLLKTGHDRSGLKTQLNLFFRTDFFYGDEEFTLADMTDAYKEEFEAASDWLKFAFHAKQEFPDYPYINADYDTVKNNFTAIKNEVIRFAGPKSFAHVSVNHWGPMSREGIRALKDCGVRLMSASVGVRTQYNGDPFTLPYGHAGRLLQNRQPETMLYHRGTLDVAIDSSICGYNHISEEENAPIFGTLRMHKDEKMGVMFKPLYEGPCLNLSKKEDLADEFAPLLNQEFIGYGTHEQYFHSDYYQYQPDYGEKVLLAADILAKNGYTFIFADDLLK